MSSHPGYLPVLLWSIVIGTSFWGWGEALRRLLNRKEFEDLGWGLTMAWGMAVTLAFGGLLMAFSAAKAPVLTMVVLAGAALAGGLALSAKNSTHSKTTRQSDVSLSRAATKKSNVKKAWRHFDGANITVLIILSLLAALAFSSSIAWPAQIDPNDDVVCYLFFPERILQTGSLIEPFNVRRLGTFGGQSLLQALVMVVGAERSGHVPDRGFGMLMIFGMLLRLTRGMPATAALFRLLLVGSVFFISVPRINTSSSLGGASVLLALLMTFDRIGKMPPIQMRVLLPSALLIAAAGSLRPTFLLCAVAITTISLTLPTLLHVLKITRTAAPGGFLAVKTLGFIGVLSFVALAPWMFVLWQSNATPMYPPFGGTLNPAFGVLGSKNGPLQDVAHATGFLFRPEVLALLFCYVFAWFVERKDLALAAVLSAVCVAWFTSYKFGVTVIFESYRYTFPMLFPIAIWILTSYLGSRFNSPDSPLKKYAATLALALLVAVNLPNAGNELTLMAESLPQQAVSSTQRLVTPIITKGVTELQEKTEPGAVIFAAIDTPYALNFNRNKIFTADVAGACSIGPWPLEKGPDALKNYLRSVGVDYLLVVDFENAMLLYTRRHWKEHQRPEWFFKEVWGRYMIDFMDSVDALALSERVVGRAANLRLIKLTSSQ